MSISSPFRLPTKTPLRVAESLTEWATGLSQLDKFYAQRPVNCDTRCFLRYTLEVLGIDYRVVKGHADAVPKQGATVVVANHPLGCVEGVILAELLLMLRSDVQILANQYLKTVPELDELFIGVDVFEGADAPRANLKALRQAHQHLANGGLLLLFPAGEVSQLVKGTVPRLEDKEWSRSISHLVRKSRATTVPMFIDGQNSKRFYLAGKVHPLLRTLMLGRELLNKTNHTIGISIGEPIKYKEVNSLTDAQIVHYLRLNTYLLQTPPSTKSVTSPASKSEIPVAPSLPIEDHLDDLRQLPKQHHLLSSGEFDVYCTSADHIPSIMHEIGRLRELNFRQVGEGTGNALDIDRFDRYYLQLFVWDRDKQRLVGAYRLGLVDQIVAQYGLDGLYSRTLFHYQQPFIDSMGKSIEMGRSVIDSAYQKSMAPLLLLWKGIARYVANHPDYTHLFGPVSISNDYSEQTRQLLAQTMTLHHYDNHKAEFVTPSNPLPKTELRWNQAMLSALADLQLLSRVIGRIDDGKGVPVLLRQYLALNGKLTCFNVDPDFNDALDGLIMVDLRDVPVKTLSRYMGANSAEQYLARHR
ncbi:lysophospholipid acyltransferase family protein [Vibrio sinaloensis]|uniref:lysophospholipid acyltransferase family protein n=1 Tax=Photobacterium sp. (strain ATCC 43367) TaxID=379097 RepID=UPI00206CE3AD|nr:GNAT family N-acyltransferase [Vibrio sinaloensis]UPQ87664.1 lysophospholipid acyltransferase family protein [Vibrio sinaloensis]